MRIGGVPEHFNLPWRLALNEGHFEGAGTSVRYIDYPGGTGAMTSALRRGELDAAIVLTEGAVLDILKGSNNCLVKFFVQSPLTWGIHVSADSDITDTSQIAGRTTAISRYGSGSHLIAIVDALERGFRVDDMRFELVDSLAGARDALRAGSADIFLWEKHMTKPLVDSGEFRRIGERVVPWPAFVVSVNREFLDDHRDALKEVLLRVERRAAELAADSGADRLIAETYRLRPEDAADWLETVRWGTGFDPEPAALGRVAEALRAQGAVDDSSPDLSAAWEQL